MGVYSRGEYGVPSDLIFSFPCVCKNGEWSIVLDLKISNFARTKLTNTGDELKQEKAMALKKQIKNYFN
jgi:malate dehydrogenase